MRITLGNAASTQRNGRAIEDRATRRAIADARRYQRLQPTRPPEMLDFARYLDGLCRDIMLACGIAGQVRLDCVAKDSLLPQACAVRLGLIAEELIISALRHSLLTGAGGLVAVCFSTTPDNWVLQVEDSGVDQLPGSSPYTSLRIATALTTLLGGEFVLAAMPTGTRCVVTLPRQHSSPIHSDLGTEPIIGVDASSTPSAGLLG
jgi:two-component sensor histidine kinase